MSEPLPLRPAADRNLLLGVLALQMDFIHRDALIAAMQAWVFHKDKALGQILLEQKALSPDRRALLEALLQEHLKLHGDDPARSLAAVSSVHSLRQDLQQIADADVQASLVHMGRPRQTEPDPFATRAPSVGTPTSSGVRFRILRPHAEGGLGKVLVAEDGEFHREVALKEIKDRHADDPESRSRFLLEAEITGGLEHPGIVPVYGLGQYADGRPFYAMRFIKGDSLNDAIKRYHRTDGPGADPASASWNCASCWAGSSTSATPSPTRIAAASCTATSSRATSCWGTMGRRWWWTGGWPSRWTARRRPRPENGRSRRPRPAPPP